MNPEFLAALHAAYCRVTGLNLPYVPWQHDSDWYLFSKRFDEHDLKRVVAHLQKLYAGKPCLTSMLRFRHLICRLDYFGEYLAEANREHKATHKTDLDRVLLATARKPATTHEKPIKSAADTLKASAFVKEHMAEFRKQMGWI